MNLLLKIFLHLTWLTTFAHTTPPVQNITQLNQDISCSKTEIQHQEGELNTYFTENEIYNITTFQQHFPYESYASDVDIIFSEVDFWSDENQSGWAAIPSGYNTNSINNCKGGLYYYTISDLDIRLKIIEGNTHTKTALFKNENNGEAHPLNLSEWHENYYCKYGSDHAFYFMAEWSARFAEDIAGGYVLNSATVKLSKLFANGVKSPSTWKSFVGFFKKSQKVKNKATQALSSNPKIKNLVDDLADNQALASSFDDAGFKFKLPTKNGEDAFDVIEIGYDGRIKVNTSQKTISDFEVEFGKIELEFPANTEIKVGNQTFTSGKVEVLNDGVVRFVGSSGLKLADNLQGVLKNTHETLLQGGCNFIDEGTKIKYLTKSGDEFAIIENNTLKRTHSSGKWPVPSEYLNQSYIDAHLAKFDGEVSTLTFENSINTYNQIGRDNGLFILTKSEMDDLLIKTGGDISLIETELGIPTGTWNNRINDPLKPDKLIRVDIKKSKNHNLRMATGNEDAANDLWLPGGKTPKNHLEAVINPVSASETNSYIKTEITP